jgi:hypothetical protein
MKDPERLASAGTEEEKRLLRAARTVRVPERLQQEIRRAVEAELRPPGTRRRLWFGLAGALLAATAGATTVPVLWKALQGPRPRPSPAAPHAGDRRPVVVPLAPSPPAPARPPATSAPAPHVSPAAPLAHQDPPAEMGGPALDLPGFLRGAVEPARPPSPSPAPAARLLIARSDRRDISLEATATTVRGQVRGRAVALSLDGTTLTGRIGDDQVNIHIFTTREAHGTVGGRDVDFAFAPTEHGWLADVSLPDVGGRITLDASQLTFRPGCDRALALADRPGLYRGTCSDDSQLRVEVPATFLDPMARLVVLGMLLPEPEPMLRGRVPGLFPPP